MAGVGGGAPSIKTRTGRSASAILATSAEWAAVDAKYRQGIGASDLPSKLRFSTSIASLAANTSVVNSTGAGQTFFTLKATLFMRPEWMGMAPQRMIYRGVK